MTSHVIAYRSLELLFGTHTFHFNCFFEDFNCIFTQIRCLSRVLMGCPPVRGNNPRALSSGLSYVHVDNPWYNYFIPPTSV